MKQHLINVYILLIFTSGSIYSQVTSEQAHYGASSLSMAASDIAIPKTSWSAFVNAAGIVDQQGVTFVASSQSHFSQDFLSHSLF